MSLINHIKNQNKKELLGIYHDLKKIKKNTLIKEYDSDFSKFYDFFLFFVNFYNYDVLEKNEFIDYYYKKKTSYDEKYLNKSSIEILKDIKDEIESIKNNIKIIANINSKNEKCKKILEILESINKKT